MPRLSLGLRYDDSPFIGLFDVTGRTRASLQMDSEGNPALKLFNNQCEVSFNGREHTRVTILSISREFIDRADFSQMQDQKKSRIRLYVGRLGSDINHPSTITWQFPASTLGFFDDDFRGIAPDGELTITGNFRVSRLPRGDAG